jgi:hypothetical protein
MGGPLLLELVKLIGWQDSELISARWGSWKYWVGTAALFLLSGAIAVLKCGNQASLAHAVQLGINAPAIVGGFATASTTRKRKRNPERFMGMPQRMLPPAPSLLELLSW